MEKKVKAILIDPAAKTIGYVDLDLAKDGGYRALRTFVHGEASGYIERVRLGKFPGDVNGKFGFYEQAAYIDEEGLLKDWKEQSFFKFGPQFQPIAGRAVIVSEVFDPEDGAVPADVLTTVDDLHKRVIWTESEDVRVPVPTFQELDKNFRLKGDAQPIGRHDGTGHWDINHQP